MASWMIKDEGIRIKVNVNVPVTITHNNLKPVFGFLPLPKGKPAIFRVELGKKLIN